MSLVESPRSAPTTSTTTTGDAQPQPGFDRRRLVWLALGTFAVGTENLVVGAMLTLIAADLATTVARAGLLVSAFALTYAIAAPIVGAASSRRTPKVVLVGALIALAVVDIAAALAPSFGWLVAGRIVAAIAAATYTPNALALAGSVVRDGERGRATAIVYGGLAAATVIGVPLAAFAANALGWRITFAGVGTVAAVAAIGVALRLPVAPRRPVVHLADWARVARIAVVRRTLLVTFVVYTGQFVAFAFIAPIVDRITGTDGGWVTVAVFAFGVAAVVGNPLGGKLSDTVGPDRVASVAQVLTAVGLATLTLLAWLRPDGPVAIVALAVAMAIWGLGAWSFNPPQQVRLLAGGGELGPLALAANSTALYAGIATGGLIGAVAVSSYGATTLGLVGAAIVAIALGIDRRSR